MTVQIFHSEERLVNLERRREFFVGLSILLVYGPPLIFTSRNLISTKMKISTYFFGCWTYGYNDQIFFFFAIMNANTLKVSTIDIAIA